MPIHREFVNLIVSKNSIAEKYNGGIRQFRLDFLTEDGNPFEEDDELFSITGISLYGDNVSGFLMGGENLSEMDSMLCSVRGMKFYNFDIEGFMKGGLHFDEANKFSNDFVLIGRYGTFLWQVYWASHNVVFVWHIKCAPKLIVRAMKIEETTIDDIEIAFQKGENPYETIRKKD